MAEDTTSESTTRPSNQQAVDLLRLLIHKAGLKQPHFFDLLSELGFTYSPDDLSNWARLGRRVAGGNWAALRAMVQVLASQPARKRCKAEEALRFLDLAEMPFGELAPVATMFPAGELEDALALYHLLYPLGASSIPLPTSFSGNAPPPPALFVGRLEVLQEIKKRVIQGTPLTQTIFAIHGLPGVGKSTVAAALAHDPEIATLFPDGVLWASFGSDPNLFSELAAWGRALGVSGIERSESVQEISTRLAALLRQKQMLLIVDDVWEIHHAVPFRIGSPKSALFITTRLPEIAHALASHAEAIYPLAVLSDSAALDLLEQLAPYVVNTYPGESMALVQQLGSLPLALQVAGRLLHMEYQMGLDVRELLLAFHEGDRLLRAPITPDLSEEVAVPVARVLERSVQGLPLDVRHCFILLGIFAPKPAMFSLEAIRVVWNREDPLSVTRTLVARGLLEPAGNGRFQLHPLLTTYARDLLRSTLPAAARYGACHRHAAYYTEILRQADELHDRGVESSKRSLDLLHFEWENIRTAQTWIASHAAQDSGVARLNQVHTSSQILEMQQHPSERIAYLEAALAVAQDLGDHRAEAVTLGTMGKAFLRLGDWQRAIDYHQKEVAIARALPDRFLEAAALNNLGNSYGFRGESELALECHVAQLRISQELGNPEQQVEAMTNIGLCQHNLGDVRSSIEIFTQVLALATASKNYHLEGAIHGHLGRAYLSVRELDSALPHYEDSLRIAQELGDRGMEIRALGNLGTLYRNLGELQQAIEYHERQLSVAIQSGDRLGEGNALGCLGIVYRYLKEPNQSVVFFEKALEVHHEIGNRRMEVVTLDNLGLSYVELNQLEQAIRCHETALGITRETHDRLAEARLAWSLGLDYERLGEYVQAAAFMQICVDYERETSMPELEEDAQHLAQVQQKAAQNSAGSL